MGGRGNNSTQNNVENQGRTGTKAVCSHNSIIQATKVLLGQKPLNRKLTGEFDCIIEQQTLGQILFGTHLSNITKTIPLGVSPQSARRNPEEELTVLSIPCKVPRAWDIGLH